MTGLAFLGEGHSHWLLSGCALVVFYVIGSAIYNFYFSPLAKYPGPFLAKISSLPSFYYALTGYRHIWIWQCHQVYGETFRYHPNGILVNSPEGYREIYSTKANVKRGSYYDAWPRDARHPGTLHTTDIAAHARKRRVLNSVFSEKSISSFEPFIVKHVDRWCQLLLNDSDKNWTEPKNMARLSDYLIFDILGDLCFGKSFETKEPGENQLRVIPHSINRYMKFINPLAQSPFLGLWNWLKPRGLDGLLERLSPKEMRKYYEFVTSSVAQRTELEHRFQNQDSEEKDRRRDMFHYLIQARDGETGAPAYSKNQLQGEAGLLIVAGTDTTAITISGFFFYITRYPRVYTKLAKEIRSTFDSIDEIHGGVTLSSCHYLRACIDEALRMCPSAPCELQRQVLPGGLKLQNSFLPEGVRVGTSAWSFNYNEQCFTDPYVYRPERWIIDEDSGISAEDVSRAQSCSYPFTSGPGNCVGKNLALLEIMITVSRTLFQMDVRAAPGDTLGEGSSELGWGRRLKHQFQVRDAYVSLRDGPMVQFRRRATT